MASPIDKATIQVQDWPGLQSNFGPMSSEKPGSAADLVNLRVIVTGELAARDGLRRIQFDTEE